MGGCEATWGDMAEGGIDPPADKDGATAWNDNQKKRVKDAVDKAAKAKEEAAKKDEEAEDEGALAGFGYVASAVISGAAVLNM